MTFRRRGIEISVDTTQPAEFDLLFYEAPAADVARIEASLSRLPVSRFDVPMGCSIGARSARGGSASP